MAYRPTFLNTRTPREAWPRVLELFKENGFVISRVRTELGVSHTTIMRWLRENPEYSKQLKAEAKKGTEI